MMPSPGPGQHRGGLLLALALGAGTGSAAEPAPLPLADPAGFNRLRVLDEYRDPDAREAWIELPGGPLSAWSAMKQRLSQRHGLDFEIVYAPIFQTSRDPGGGNTANAELDFIGSWTLTDDPVHGAGKLQWWVTNLVNYTGRNTGQFADDLGVLSQPNDGDLGEDANFTGLPLLWWEQPLPSGLIARIGKLGLTELAGTNRYAHDGRADYLNSVLVKESTAGYTVADGGLGINLELRRERWSLSATFADASADDDWVDFSSPGDGDWQAIGEAALTPRINGLGAGNYRLTLSQIDAIEVAENDTRSGWGIGFSADQELGEDYALMLRWSGAVRRMTDFRQVFAAGFLFTRPFGWDDDTLGLAAWRASPEPNLDPPPDAMPERTEYGLEAFWRMQLTDHLELTPDLQLILDPAKDTSRDQVLIAGVRLRLVF